MADLTGKTLGNYRLVQRIGRGGMATVYKAYQPALERYVAVKIIHEQLAAEDEQFFKRFQREAKAVANLRHANIVQIFDFGVEGDVSYMVMEYLEGVTLKAELNGLARQGETMLLAEAQRIIQALASAVEYAHRQGMAHRDLKPANVMLTTKGDVVLTDFGIAKIVGGTQYTATGAIMGTPAYMSPEQGQGERGDERSDIYALGVMLYEMTTGRVPFDADTPLAVIYKHISDPLPLPSDLNPSIPEGVEQVILKALAKKPDDRYQRAADMASALADAVVDETTRLGLDADAPQVVEAERTALIDGAPRGPDVATSVAPLQATHAPPRASPLAGIPAWALALGGVVLGGLLLLIVILATTGIGRQLPIVPAWAPSTAPVLTQETAAQPLSTGALIVDNTDPGFAVEAGEWGDCENGDCGGTSYGVDFLYAEPGCASCQARFEVSVATAGEYDVWTWWPRGDDRATDTPYTVTSEGGAFTVRVDQRNAGSAWYRLGTVSLKEGESVRVVVVGTDTGYANADAVALTPVGSGPPTTLAGVSTLIAEGIIVDNADPGFAIEAGEWGDCENGDCGGTSYSVDFLYADPDCATCRARFEIRVPATGEYDVWTWWPQGDDRATDTPYTVTHEGGAFTVTIDQRNQGSAWYRIGRVSLEAGESVSVVVASTESGYANADAVALTPAEPGQ